jgi:adenylyl-sulfate kinase
MRFRISYNKLSKSIIYRVVSSSITVGVSYFVTKNIKFGLSIGALDLMFKIVNYYTFDTIWDSIFKKNINSCVVWVTGLSGSGKSTIVDQFIKILTRNKIPYVLLDGDQIRKVINETGFDFLSRRKHNLNVAYIASLLESQGNVVIVSLISPYKEVRKECRNLCRNFVEVFINTPVEVCEERDTKGLYKKARQGEIENFTGISFPYEESEIREITIDTNSESPENSAKIIYNYLRKNYKRKKLDASEPLMPDF